MEKTNGGNLIQIKNLVATVNLNNGDTLVTVNKANMELKRGNSYAIVGKSGSGKTSLISIIGLLNHSYQGEFLYNGMSVSTLTDSQLSMLRASNIGFVFQNYSLIKHLIYQEANNKEWRLPAHLQYRRKPFYVMNLLVL